MNIESFKMERWQSLWEHKVEYNLSESGVHPFSIEELLAYGIDFTNILNTRLGYIQTDGTPELKKHIARLYTGVTEENILVTTGSSEANMLSIWSLVKPGTETAFMLPNFMQIYGLMKSYGANVKTFFLKEDKNWQPDLKELKSIINKRTEVISITNPNNPTGAQLKEQAREAIIDLAKWSGAWLICDEVYQGAELDEKITPSFWGRYDKTIVTCGLSKSFGLSGLRVGWAVAPRDIIRNLWKHKDYTTISISALSDRLACAVLESSHRKKIFKRTRGIIKNNFGILKEWMDRQGNLFHCIPPKAGAIAFPGYTVKINASELAERVLREKSVLLQPGDHMEVDHHIRFGLGEESEKFKKALNLLEEFFRELA